MSEPPRRSNGGLVTSAVGDVVDVFRNSPSLLFIMLLNIIFLGGLGYLLLELGARRHEEFQQYMTTSDRRYDELMRVCFRQLRPDNEEERR